MNAKGNTVTAYGDTRGDGAVQLSFTLPMPSGEKARQAALVLTARMGLQDARVVLMDPIDPGFTYFVVYAETRETVDVSTIQVHEVAYEAMEPEEINRFIRETFGRKLVVIGACIGSDAHTVGIDAIMNMKGYDMHKGLESYPEIRALNLGAQVPCETLAARAAEEKADAVLVSQVVTQKNAHLKNLTRLIELLETEGLSEEMVLIVGGPQVTPELAKELGYDAGFGRGTFPGDVASYLVQELADRESRRE
ncbi:MAG: cobalamin-dependent protein [Deltaproteobacteria bacterium]|nr:cobalamin-dependent protein [Deltaproteobacteria bacterium]